MKILMTNDLHGDDKSYQWILKNAHQWDLIAIAGDLFDMLTPTGIYPQMCAFDQWLGAMRKTGKPVAFCSGNHDVFSLSHDFASLGVLGQPQELLHRLLAHENNWFSVFAADGVTIDGATQLLTVAGEQLLVSCIPYSGEIMPVVSCIPYSGEIMPVDAWRDGVLMKRRNPAVPWLVLHHEPPADFAVGGMNGSTWIADRILDTPPTYLMSGHLHEQPFARGGSWIDRTKHTWCFNPGQPYSFPSNTPPNHIILDTNQQEATWHHWDVVTKKCGTKKHSLSASKTARGRRKV